MKVFLIVMVVLFALEAGGTLRLQPGEPRPALSAGTIVVIALIDMAMVVWAATLLFAP